MNQRHTWKNRKYETPGRKLEIYFWTHLDMTLKHCTDWQEYIK